MNESGAQLLGRQEPTYLWVPDYEETYGQEAIDLAAAAGLILDPWQQSLINHACALDPLDSYSWLLFELAALVSRQNGKGSWLEALELAWLFLFGDRLILHSAHLFETSREHFLRMQALITNHDDFRRRVRRMREGRGSEEIELLGGQRLKFMTRKGGAGRGFTGEKNVYDEAMYLDSTMMAASLPTLATRPNAQVVYAGSAGMKHSTQLALVRKRGYARDPGLMLAEWAAEKPVYDERGDLIDGDDPAAPRTWAKVNPGFGIRISETYIRREMAALGGPNSPDFWRERLGIGDWPIDDEAWEVIDKGSWQDACDPGGQVPDGAPVAFGAYVHPKQEMGTIGVCGLRQDGKLQLEVVARHRGTAWMVPWFVERKAVYGRYLRVAILKSSEAAKLIDELVKAKVKVLSPSEIAYAQACGSLHMAVKETRTVVHLGQASLNASVGGAQKREGAEGGWRWSPDAPADVAPIASVTLARWLHKSVPVSDVWVASDADFEESPVPQDAVTDRGASGFASARRVTGGAR